METAQKMENRMLTPEIKRNLEIIIVRMKGKKVTDKNILNAIKEEIEFESEMADGKTERAKRIRNIVMKDMYGLCHIFNKGV